MKNNNCILLLMYFPAMSAIDFPRLRIERISTPKSWTAPINMLPKNIQIMAGTHPQITAIAGPTIGPVPAIEAKWCPKIISFFVGW